MKKSILLFVLLVLIGFRSFGQNEEIPVTSFLKFIEVLESSPLKNRQELVDKYYSKLANETEFPIINGAEVTFVYKGSGSSVKLSGDMTGWEANFIQMRHIDGTDIYYKKKLFEANARIDYKIVVDNKWILDPLNKKISKSGFGENSEFSMPLYPKQPEVAYYEEIPHGSIIKDQYISCNAVKKGRIETSSRRYHVYLPPNYSKDKKYTTLYFQDGMDYIFNMKINNVLDYMIYNKDIDPVIAVFIDYIDRDEDYIKNQKDVYADFLLNEFVPFIDSNYSTIKNRKNRVIIGLSNSGSSAVYISHKNSEIFGKVLSHSGAVNCLYTNGTSFGSKLNENLGDRMEIENYPVKIYLNAGTYEGFVYPNKRLYDQLKKNPSVIDVKFDIENQGHALPFWRDTTREALIWLLQEEKTSNI